MSTLKVSIVTNAKEETATFTKCIFSDEIELLLQTESEMRNSIETINVLIPGHINVDAELIKNGTNLKMIHCGTGYNNIDIETCNMNGIYVAVTPNVAAQSVAELVFACFLTLVKKIIIFDHMMKNGDWKITDFIESPELKGKTLGIIGYGNIGKASAQIARGFNMNLIAYDPHIKITDSDVSPVSFEYLLKKSDFITLHVLLTSETKGMISTPQFEMMKNNVIIANVCRGLVIDEAAITKALMSNRIGGACLDVFEKEPLAKNSILRQLNNVILTPHIGYCSNEALKRRFQFFADNCQRILDGEKPKMVINADAISYNKNFQKVNKE
jgi:D-3-phosphoglycerate dehydrogenase|tara:strand:+ start:569 stop:1552 length:984 start_codon:yes stop_codon:yes gene_type:complete